MDCGTRALASASQRPKDTFPSKGGNVSLRMQLESKTGKERCCDCVFKVEQLFERFFHFEFCAHSSGLCMLTTNLF